jgi:hypothetical protein
MASMYLRETRQKRADGSRVTHLQLAESVWKPRKKRSEVRLLDHGGRADDPQSAERRRQLAHRLLKRWAPEAIVEQAPPWGLIDAWPFGALYVLEAIWHRLGRDEVIARQLASHQVDVAVERARLAMVANRAWAPSAKRYGDEPWLRADGRMDGTATLALPHLDRAMDVLAAHQEAREPALDCRLAALLSLDVELIFYDTTSLHFDIDAIDWGVGAADCVEGSLAAGAKPSKAPRKRGLANNGRGEAPQMVVGLAVTRDGLPVRHWVLPGHTVAVTTVAQVKAALRGWQLRRCVGGGRCGDGVARASHPAQREWRDIDPVSAHAPRR